MHTDPSHIDTNIFLYHTIPMVESQLYLGGLSSFLLSYYFWGGENQKYN